MRLAALTLFHIRLPLQQPFATSRGVLSAREAILLRLQGEGLEAWGECSAGSVPGYTPETLVAAWDWYQALARRWLGQVLPHPADFIAAQAEALRRQPMAVAGWEMALWDAWGQVHGQSLAALLGARRPKVTAGVVMGVKPSHAALCAQAQAYLRQGYRRLKIKIKPGYDVQPVAALRACLPAGFPLQVDANGAYTSVQADELLRLDAFSLQMIEQPFSSTDWEAHRALQARLDTPLCLDEGFQTPAQAAAALQAGVCRAINVKPARLGGLTMALEVVRVAKACCPQALLWVGGMLETGLGRAASLALAALDAFALPPDISASARYYPQDVITVPFCLDAQGALTVPSAPGLGVRVDWDNLQRFTLRKLEFRA